MAKKSNSSQTRKSTAPVSPQTRKTAARQPETFWNHLEGFWGQAAVLLLVVIAVYGNTLANGYALDDYMVILDNQHTRKGVEGIPALMVKDSMHGIFGDSPDRPTLTFYRPLSYVTFAIEYEIWGENPLPGHLNNMLLFGLTCVLLLGLLRTLLPNQPWMTGFAVLLFAVHPVQTEVVANIKGRDELLSLLLALAALYAGLRFVAGTSLAWGWGVISGAAFLLALLSKENAVTALVLLPLTVFVFRTRDLRRVFLSVAPLVGVFVLYLIVRTSIIGFDLENETDNILNNRYIRSDWSEALATKLYVLLRYLGLLFWPAPLQWDYSYNAIGFRSFADPEVWLSIVLHTALLGYALWKLPHRAPLAYAILFYFVSMALVSNLFINLGGFVAVRFLYQASVGFCLAVALTLFGFRARWLRSFSPAGDYVLAGVLGLVCVLAAAHTIGRNAEWKNNATLFIADAEKGSGSASVNRAGGTEYLNRAQNAESPEEKQPHLDRGLVFLRKALAILPDHVDANLEMMRAYSLMEQFDSAEYYFRIAQRKKPNAPRVVQNGEYLAGRYYFRGNRLVNQGAQASGSEKNAYIQQAIAAYRSGLSFNPQSTAGLVGMGNAYFQVMALDSTEKYYLKALEISPQDTQARKNASVLYSKRAELAIARQDYDRAVEMMKRVVELMPHKAVNWENLGYTLVMAGRAEEAISYYEKAVSMEPQVAKRWYNLGWGSFQAGQYDKARQAWERTLQLNPNSAQARMGLQNLPGG